MCGNDVRDYRQRPDVHANIWDQSHIKERNCLARVIGVQKDKWQGFQ